MTLPSNEVRRAPHRGAYDRETIDAILDEGLVAHMGLVEDGHPVVIPVSYARDGDRVLIHGSPASRLFRDYRAGAPACLTVTLLDGMVLARSAFNSSMNYRSVVLFGRMAEITDPAEKRAALDALVDGLLPGRRDALRPMTDKEVKATMVLAMTIDRASAKVRTGPPGTDDDEDADWPVWAGVIPLTAGWGPPEPAPNLIPGIDPSEDVTGFRR